jgi:tRNA A37 threonylcarbamoyladenosine synthetase subunit TsaC/SUA5/YrdC
MLLKIYPENPNPREIAQVIETLRNGGLIIYPTDTIYGIGCDIFNAKAVEAICKLKGIDPRKANLSFICYDLST